MSKELMEPLMSHRDFSYLIKGMELASEEYNRVLRENKIMRDLLEEAADWLCPHDPEAHEMQKKGVRGWCSSCSNYLRSDEDRTLLERVRNYLSQLSDKVKHDR